MYLDEAEEIFSYWEHSPPVYQMASIIAQMLGWKSASSASSAPARPASAGDVAPHTLMLSGIFAPAQGSVAQELSDLARMATAGAA